MKVLGVILARAGSLGLKNKHLLPLLGRPVIAYTFDHARQARRLTHVVVTSDCPRILELATGAGFETIHRPDELASSDASVQAVMLHAMRTFESRARDGFRADALVVLYGNVPLRPACAIDRAIEILQTTGCDSVRSWCPVGKWHPAWMARLEGDRVVPLQPNSIHRRQDLAPLYLHDGAVVAVSRSSMLRAQTNPHDPHAFFGDDRRGFATGAGETIEIDQLRDLYWAESVLRERAQTGQVADQSDLLRIAS
ncbi:cytidylyltransferase domain-containing protein [Fontivita pretiosa]|uniref:acylneuraminate cytidylyltransferase family protein n=1 Tax=Fontivita pretiosa TaxID=2989684 RepID=UPI003D185CD9